MHEMHLTSEEHAAGCPGCTAFLEELKALSQRGARVYALPVDLDTYHYKLVTTSKDLFLGLGRLSQWARAHLCTLICDAIGEQPDPVIYTLPSFTDDGERRSDRSMLVSIAHKPDNDGAYVLHLSPAN